MYRGAQSTKMTWLKCPTVRITPVRVRPDFSGDHPSAKAADRRDGKAVQKLRVGGDVRSRVHAGARSLASSCRADRRKRSISASWPCTVNGMNKIGSGGAERSGYTAMNAFQAMHQVQVKKRAQDMCPGLRGLRPRRADCSSCRLMANERVQDDSERCWLVIFGLSKTDIFPICDICPGSRGALGSG